jgi:hypothetical protein
MNAKTLFKTIIVTAIVTVIINLLTACGAGKKINCDAYSKYETEYPEQNTFAKILFGIKVYTGFIVPSSDVDGRIIYAIPTECIEYAYKSEIIQYLETGVFTYDDTLDDPVVLSELQKNNK